MRKKGERGIQTRRKVGVCVCTCLAVCEGIKCYSVFKKRQCIRVIGSGNRERDCALMAVKERATFEVLRGRVGKGRIP